MEFINRKIKANGMLKTIMYLMLIVLLAPMILGATLMVLKLGLFVVVAGVGIHYINKGIKYIKRGSKEKFFSKKNTMENENFYSDVYKADKVGIDSDGNIVVDVEYEDVK